MSMQYIWHKCQLMYLSRKKICSLQIHNQLPFICRDIMCYSPYVLTCNVNGADFHHHIYCYSGTPGCLEAFSCSCYKHGCKCSTDRLQPLCHKTENGGKIFFPFKIHPHSGSNSDTSALLLLFPVYFPLLYVYLSVPAGHTH